MKSIANRNARCVGGSCPDVYLTERGTIVVVGAKPNQSSLSELEGRIAKTETAVEIQPALLKNLDWSTSPGET